MLRARAEFEPTQKVYVHIQLICAYWKNSSFPVSEHSIAKLLHFGFRGLRLIGLRLWGVVHTSFVDKLTFSRNRPRYFSSLVTTKIKSNGNTIFIIIIIHQKLYMWTMILIFIHLQNTDLSQFLENHPGGLCQHNVRMFMYQLLRGLAYCHRRRILHRDVKPQNLLISEQGELKLADFGEL